MPFWRAYYHLVWATKNRAHLIQPEIEPRLYSYLSAKARELELRVYALNGWTDHVHLVLSIPPKHAIAYVVKRLKGASSFDLNHEFPKNDPFNWQRGYGVFTLGESQLDRAIAYVQNQKQHHQQQTINSWLERMNEFDEGPPDDGLPTQKVPALVRESQTVYQVWREDETPF